MSQTIDTAISATDQWSIAMDTTPQIPSQYQHQSHPYLSDPQLRQPIEKWPKFISRMQTSPCWRLKLPSLSTRTTKIPSKYRHPLSSQQMKGLPKGWVYVKDAEEDKREELHDQNQYSHLPPWLILAQQQLKRSLQSNHPRDLSTTLGTTLSPSPSPMNMESQPQHGSSC